MKKTSILIILLLISFNLIKAQIVSFDFNTSPYLNTSSSNTYLLVSELSLSQGTISTNVTTGTYFTDEPYVEESGGWGQTNEGDAKYFYVDISAVEGYRFSITNIAFEAYATGAGPAAVSILLNSSSVYSQNMPEATLQAVSRPITGYSQITQLTLKIAGWDNGSRTTSGGGAFRLDNLIIDGSVEEIPANDSSSTIKVTTFSIPDEIPSLQNTLPMPVLEFSIIDSATADGENTIIDSLVLQAGTNNYFTKWNSIINEVKLISTAFADTVLGRIEDQKITFNTTGIFEVDQGLAFADTCKVLLSLKQGLPNADGRQLEFLLDSAHVYCNPAGSKVGWGSVKTGINKLNIQVEATELHVRVGHMPLWQDSIFSIAVEAVDANGNIDIDENGSIQLEHISGNGVLQSVNSLLSDFIDGKVVFNGLNFTLSDTATIKISSENFTDYLLDSLLVGKYCFYDDFENGNLANWHNTSDWQASPVDSIDGGYSLKHNLSGVSGTSYISSVYNEPKMDYGKMIWRFVLKNGNFDPTSSNRFWYYLMAADSNLTSAKNYGYAVGVNFLGSNDTLSLWKIDSLGNKTLVVETGFDWDKNNTVAIEVIREVPGSWQIAYAENIAFNNLIYTQKFTERGFVDLPYHGLVFQYSSTRAGQLWCDNIYAGRLNSPPKLIKAQGIANNTVELTFSEPIVQSGAENISNYLLTSETDDQISVEQAVFDNEFPNRVLLKVNSLKTTDYKITVSNIADSEGSIMQPESLLFWYEVPAERHNVVFTEIMFDHSPAVGLPEADYLEIFNRGGNPFNLGGWQLVIDGLVKTFPDTIIGIGEYVIVTSAANTDDFLNYGKTIGMISSTSLTNSGKPLWLISKNGLLIDSLFYKPDWITDEEKQDGGWSLERIDPDNLCGAAQNWSASVDTKGGTPGTQNSVYAPNIDTIAPKLTNWELQSLTTFTFGFSEELDFNSVNIHVFFTTEPEIGLIDSINLSQNSKNITVYLASPIQPNSGYNITLRGVADLCGNIINDTTVGFLYHPPTNFDVVINEIMADPVPSVGLPESDYLELYNRSIYTINLTGWELWFGNTRKVFPEKELLPNECLIVCQTGAVESFQGFGNVVGLLSSTSLSASGRAVVIKDTSGLVIDSVYYVKGWYKNPDKEDGGWSLERIDPDNLCGAAQNWSASIDTKGGTPGTQNSVYAPNIDTIAPKLTNWELQSLTTFAFGFSEELDFGSVNSHVFFTVEPEIGLIDSINLSQNSKNIIVYLANPIQPNSGYNITLRGVADLCGNIINDTTIDFLYHPPNNFDVVINEIMADPVPSVGLPESDYLELYNRSAYTINLTGWELWFGNTRKVFPEKELLPNEYLIVCQTGAVESFQGFGNVVGLLSSTSLSASGRSVVIKDTSGLVIDSVYYVKGWYKNPDKEDGGWSLERIDPDNLCGAAQNWSASVDTNGGTPGTQNSVYAHNIDIISPKVIYFKVAGYNSIVMEFSEALDYVSAKNTNNYSFGSSQQGVDSIVFFNADQTAIELFIDSPFQYEVSYILNIQNVTDLCGNAVADTLFQFEFNYIDVNDIVITEIMVDPLPIVGLPEFEYIELYNRSEKSIDIEGWQLAVNGSKKVLPRFTVLAESYLVILSNTAFNEFEFIENKIALNGFMSLPNQAATIQLLDTAGIEINRIQYNSSWYHDSEKDNGGWSLEIIDPDNQCGGINNWLASNSILGGTPGSLNSVNANNIDDVLPSVVGAFPIVGGEFDNAFVVRFSEIIDAATVLSANFTIGEFGHPRKVYVDSLTLLYAVIEFSGSFEQKTHYNLSVKGVGDYCNNILADTVLGFDYYESQLYDIVINEVMANPVPSAGLLEVEYIEVYNRTLFDISAYKWGIQVGSSIRKLPYINIPAQSYLVLCNTDDVELFNAEIRAIGVESLPSLPLSSTVTLINSNNELICQTKYNSLWFIDDFKAGGGYSLERIDFNNPDETAKNWKGADSEDGGTPGFANSVYKNNPDETPPDLLRAFPANDTLIGLQFSKSINYSAITVGMFDIEGEEGLINSFKTEDNRFSIIYLLLNGSLETGVEYTINVSDEVTDISGNYILKRSTKFIVPTKASPNDIVINELLFNPLDGGVDFVELYNRSAFTVNLKQFYIATFDDAGSIKNPKRITFDGALLFPAEYVAISENGEVIKQQYRVENDFAFYDTEKLPAFPNSGGSVVILDTSGVVIDYLYYTESMHFGLLNNTKGVSLERINFNRPSQERYNWHSAAEQAGWATPGYKNSMYNELGNTDRLITIEPEAFSPDNDGYNDVLYIHYSFDAPGYVANVTVFDSKGRTVIKVIENELMGIEGTLSWDGLNYNGQRVPIGLYIINFEIFDIDGNVKRYRRVCAVNARFD